MNKPKKELSYRKIMRQQYAGQIGGNKKETHIKVLRLLIKPGWISYRPYMVTIRIKEWNIPFEIIKSLKQPNLVMIVVGNA